VLGCLYVFRDGAPFLGELQIESDIR
jgi:hypothetical protein